MSVTFEGHRKIEQNIVLKNSKNLFLGVFFVFISENLIIILTLFHFSKDPVKVGEKDLILLEKV